MAQKNRYAYLRWPALSIATLALVVLLGSLAGKYLAQGRLTFGRTPVSQSTGIELAWHLDHDVSLPNGITHSLISFSPDGRFVAVQFYGRALIVDAANGQLIGSVSTGDLPVFALAISANQEIALGRLGSLELVPVDRDSPSVRYGCIDGCGAITAATFSTNGRLLAYQNIRGDAERRQRRIDGWVNVIDLQTGLSLVALGATARRAHLSFSDDDQHLLAASATEFGLSESYGARLWRTSDWALVTDMPGVSVDAAALGKLGGVDHASVAENNGRLEARDLATSSLMWSVPLVAADEPEFPITLLGTAVLAPDGSYVLTYEGPAVGPNLPILDRAKGTLVIRRADGDIEAMFDIPGITSLVVSPDSKTFAFVVGAGQPYTGLAKLP